MYPKEFLELKVRVSFGMGAPARVPWISLLAPEMATSNGIYPVYLYYKDLGTLILAYGISETVQSGQSWPAEIINSVQTVNSYFDKKIPRYGDSFVFKAYKVTIEQESIKYIYSESEKEATSIDIESDLITITEYYKKILSIPTSPNTSIANEIGQGLFYMEKQLEDFIIHNWPNTELGEKYDLIIEEGDLLSQQYKTDIGPIDILAKDKKTGSYVVIELKRNQTSDDTVGQLARYMGWVKENKKDKNVKGVIIAGSYDKKLDYAREMIPNIEVFIYQVDFKLKEFKK
jgi:restriction system protein